MRIESNKLPVGTRVKMTEEALRQQLDDGYLRRRFGVITGHGREPDLIQVKCDGLKTSGTWHQKFWRKALNEGRAA
jgi:hypothetical protein